MTHTRTSRIPFAASVALVALSASPMAAQDRPWTLPDDPTVLEGFLAWDRGDYPTALRLYLEALDEDAGPDRVRDIAELTGEVWTTTEIARDGEDLVMGPDGIYMAFVVEEDDIEVTKVVSVESGLVVATIEGTGIALGPTGQAARLVVAEPSDELRTARAAMEAAPDRQARIRAARSVAWFEAMDAEIRILDVATGAERTVDAPGPVLELGWAGDALLAVGAMPDGSAGWVRHTGTGTNLPTGRGFPTSLVAAAGDRVVIEMSADPVLSPPGVELAPDGVDGVVIVSLDGTSGGFMEGAEDVSISADGARIAWATETADGSTEIAVGELAGGFRRTASFRTSDPLSDPAISPDGRWVAFQRMQLHDWDIWAMPSDDPEGMIQITTDIQHDREPMWVGDRILSAKGEGRHQRSYLNEVVDVSERVPPLKLHHNNSIRTIAPEYEWIATPDGSAVFLVSERDGDTVSPERGVYRVDLTRPVTEGELRNRIQVALAAETDLRERGETAFAPMAGEIREVTEAISTARIYHYAADLYRMGSKNITQPGNPLAIDYLVETLRRWGYEPILEWFEPRPGITSSNVVVRIEGSSNPELVYVVSSHFDSSARGPGADDNSSGSTALLEVARALAGRRLPATIELAWFTGEESGLLGSRYYVSRAQETGKRIVGALNNDMVGWANDHRLDNTIRYSNPGIRDIQHAAAMMFSDLITYDALYYKSTDAAAYYDAYGDIVGGIGSYPVLANPHYHQFTDRLETINHRLVAEVARTTAATIMLLAASPSRIAEVEARRVGDEVEVSWAASPESGVTGYRVAWIGPDGAPRAAEVDAGTGDRVTTRIPALPDGTTVSVKAIDRSGTLGWDWARAVVVGG